jgi:hypothetical protein
LPQFEQSLMAVARDTAFDGRGVSSSSSSFRLETQLLAEALCHRWQQNPAAKQAEYDSKRRSMYGPHGYMFRILIVKPFVGNDSKPPTWSG